MSVYDPGVIAKYDKAVTTWLKELPTDPKKQAVLDYTHKRPGEDLESFVRERHESKALPGQIDLMDIVSTTWNREKVIAQYQLIQMAKKTLLDDPVDVSSDGTPNPIVMEARNKWGEIKDDVEEFENKLLEAIQAYNKQMIIHVWMRFQTDWQVSNALRNQGIDTDRPKLREEFNMLDSRYYMEGNGKYMACGQVYEKLSKHKIGKLLLLDVKEIHQAAAARMGHKVEA